jgi:MFS family permease
MSISLAAKSERPATRTFAAGYATLTAITFAAVAATPTPIYRLYRENLGLTPLAVTVIFAVYSFTMIAAFLTVARLSDYVGRKPMALTSLVLNALALLLFTFADSAFDLILARSIQGVAMGIALASLGAMISDAAPQLAATLNSLTAFIGMTLGSLLAGSLVAYAPWPSRLVFAVLFALTIAEMAPLAFIAETAPRKAGALAALKPSLGLPASAAGAMIRLFPLTLAAWALGGFYLSLMPSLVITATGIHSPMMSAAVVSALMLAGGVGSFTLRSVTPPQAVRASALALTGGIVLTLFAIYAGSASGMMLGAIVAGIGFGGSYGSGMRTLLPLVEPHERAGLLSAYFVESYLSFTLPAVAAGLAAPRFGLVPTALAFASILALCAIVTLVVETIATWKRDEV